MLRILAIPAAALLMLSVASCNQVVQVGNAMGGEYGHAIAAAGELGSAAVLNEEQEDALGQSVGIALTNSYRVTSDEKLLKYVNFVGLSVAMGSDDPNSKYVFAVLEAPDVNAYSGPGGYVFITRGALNMCKDEAELAGVLAHEIAHCNHHDGLEEVRAAKFQSGVSHGAQAYNKTAGFAPLLNAGVDVLTKQAHSQPSELKADASAVHFLSNAGYNPQSYLNFLHRLAGLPGGGGVMNSHPGTSQRIATVAAELTKVKPGGTALADRFAANVKK
jgi:predicted Zn-dependent protease